MKQFFHCCLLIIPMHLSYSLSAQYVFFGERTLDNSSMAIHFDKDGLPYPDHFIADSSLQNSLGSLFTWYQHHGDNFISICAEYNFFPETINKQTIDQLNDSIIGKWMTRINSESDKFAAVAYYVHGYRKLFTSTESAVTSVTEFQLLKENLATYDNPNAYEVEVYWDGTYDCCFSTNHKKNKQLFELFEDAQENAGKVAISLRKVLNLTKKIQIQVVGHSLGAQVIAYSLFDPAGTSNIIPTPNQTNHKLSICLIAPAIDARVFHDYYNRTTPVNIEEPDNYRLMIVYNEDDFVLKKKDPKTGFFGPGANSYGRTGLGCNHHGQAEKLKSYFEKHFPKSELTLKDKTSLGKCHSWRCYTQNEELKEVSNFLWRWVVWGDF